MQQEHYKWKGKKIEVQKYIYAAVMTGANKRKLITAANAVRKAGEFSSVEVILTREQGYTQIVDLKTGKFNGAFPHYTEKFGNLWLDVHHSVNHYVVTLYFTDSTEACVFEMKHIW